MRCFGLNFLLMMSEKCKTPDVLTAFWVRGFLKSTRQRRPFEVPARSHVLFPGRTGLFRFFPSSVASFLFTIAFFLVQNTNYLVFGFFQLKFQSTLS